MVPQTADRCLRQEPDQQTVRMASTIFSYSHADGMISQSLKTLSLDLQKQRSLLPLAQGATARYQVLHSDQALPTTTILLLRTIVQPSETDIPKMDKEMKEMGRSVTRNRARPRIGEA